MNSNIKHCGVNDTAMSDSEVPPWFVLYYYLNIAEKFLETLSLFIKINHGSQWDLIKNKIGAKISWNCLFKGIVSRDFGGLQMILLNRIGVPDVLLEVYSFLIFVFI